MATVSRVKVLTGSWAGQVGEFVREDESGAVVAEMPGGRLVEFAADAVEPVKDEPEPE